MRTYYIYKYTNLVDANHKIYVGQCFNIEQRKRAHKSAAKKNSEACPLFYRALRKYGYESFSFEILEEIVTDQAGIDEREIFWIKELDATNNDVGYNLSGGGFGNSNPLNTDSHKQCPRCKLVKSREDDYTKNAYSHDGICFCCKECHAKITAEYKSGLSEEEKERRNQVRRDAYAKNPEPYIQQAKNYYENNKDKVSLYKKEYAEKNKEIIKEKNKQYKDDNKEILLQNDKEYRRQVKDANSKLTKEQIFARTPIKFCAGTCQKDIDSINFYIDLTRVDGLARICKECHKARMAINRESKRIMV